MSDDVPAHLRPKRRTPDDSASFLARIEIEALIDQARQDQMREIDQTISARLERVGVDDTTAASRQRTGRNNAFLDRMAEREAEILKALDFIALLLGRKKTSEERFFRWLAGIVSLIGALMGVLGIYLSWTAHK